MKLHTPDPQTLALRWLMGSLACLSSASALAGEFDCMIEPAQIVEIRSPVVGLLQQVQVRRGDIVQRGQVLATIESGVERSALDSARFRAQAQGALQLARARVAATTEKARRMAELHAEAMVSTQARDDAAAEQKMAESEMKSATESSQLARIEQKQAEEHLERRVLRSPFMGVVMDQYLFPGALVDTSDTRKPILKIAQTQPLHVQTILPFKLFPQVKPGLQVVVVPEAPFAREIKATIRTVDRVIDSSAGTFGVVAVLDNEKQTLPAGIRCRLSLPTGPLRD
jgi:RND family efflux transporter MFP subunit